MKIKFNLYIIIPLFLFVSCNQVDNSDQVKKFKNKLDSLHSGFNEEELTKEVIEFNKDTITIVSFGHVYSLLFRDDVFDSMINDINKQNPDYVWILGDVVFNNTDEEWKYIMEKYKNLLGRRFHAGGNHDMNYHYERYYGINDNQWEAETRFLNNIGYRYKTIEDDIANYMLINTNDSIQRIKNYLDIMLPKLNSNKQSILFTHHGTWHKTVSEAEDPKTWVRKSYSRDSLLPKLGDFDYLIHGDWESKLLSKTIKINDSEYQVMAVGNLNEGDSLYFTVIKLTHDSLWAYPIFVNIPDQESWSKKTITPVKK